MNIGVFESQPLSRRAIKSGFETLEAAANWAREEFAILFYARDEDTDNCADFITKGGTVYAIEPV